jgi:hypothetical protein
MATVFYDPAPDIDPPRPPSPVVAGIEWAPAAQIRRAAFGGDNWPITWADDDSLYAAYGDGNGFEPQLSERLSLGLARVDGGPRDFIGRNIRSPTGEQLGDGAFGKKASGMLMVDGVLYLWVRNANQRGEQCQLAWSSDHAETWHWAEWVFEQFGYCTFINYGRNYSGARDDHVYAVTPDGPSAYAAADSFVLIRVPKTSITDRGAYEFFVALDADGQPTWSQNAEDRGPVFTHENNSRRSGISYNAGISRYLWWQILGEGTTRSVGGFGVYDAPEPWGPWTTVYFTPRWDVGPGDQGSFPPKWMSPDGRSIALVFSGDDAFSVREARLMIRRPDE